MKAEIRFACATAPSRFLLCVASSFNAWLHELSRGSSAGRLAEVATGVCDAVG